MANFRDDLKTVGTGIRKAPGFLVGAAQKTATETFSARKKKTIMSALEFGPENGLKLLGVIVAIIILAIFFSLLHSESGMWILLFIFIILYDLVFSKGWIVPTILDILRSTLEILLDIGKGIVTVMIDIGMTIGIDLFNFGKELVMEGFDFLRGFGTDILLIGVDIIGIAREIVTDIMIISIDIARDIVSGIFGAMSEIIRDTLSGISDMVKDIFSFKSN
jgi:hypothetical protein